MKVSKNVTAYFSIKACPEDFAAFSLTSNRDILISVYELMKQKPNKTFLKYIFENFNIILDSGIFTLAYSKLNKRFSEKEIDDYYKKFVSYVKENIPKGNKIIEFDCQKLSSPEVAWEYRRRISKDLSSYEIINVWHFEDGVEGIRKIAEYSNYIALPSELFRNAKSKAQKAITIQIQRYIKQIKPSIKIHILGSLNNKFFVEGVTTSADATNWVGEMLHTNCYSNFKKCNFFQNSNELSIVGKEIEKISGKKPSEKQKILCLFRHILVNNYIQKLRSKK